MGHIKTASGKRWDLLEPRVEAVDVQDIAHALSMQCRFNGHCRQFYSVAQHAVVVAREVYRATGNVEEAFWGLHHDDEEAYTGDMVRPLKRLATMHEFREIARRTQAVICQAFGLAAEEPAVVKEIDSRVLASEQRDVMARWADGSPQSYDGEPFDHLAFGDPGPLPPDDQRSPGAYYIKILMPREARDLFLDMHLTLDARRGARS